MSTVMATQMRTAMGKSLVARENRPRVTASPCFSSDFGLAVRESCTVSRSWQRPKRPAQILRRRGRRGWEWRSSGLDVGEMMPRLNTAEVARLKLGENYVRPKMDSSNSPFDYATHPSSPVIKKHIEDWLRKHSIHSMFKSEESFERFVSFDPEGLVLPLYPRASMKGAVFSAYLTLILFLLDDIVDDTPDGGTPETCVPYFVDMHVVMLWSFPRELRSMVYSLLQFLDHVPQQKLQVKELFDRVAAEAELLPGTEYPYKLSPLGSAMRETWMMAVRGSSVESSLRFARELQNCAFGMIRQSVERVSEHFPSFDEYTKLRYHASGMPLLTGGICGFVTDTHMPDEVYHQPQIQRLIQLTTFVTEWTNDIASVPKELRRSDPNNAIIILSYELDCSCTEAAERMKMDKMGECLAEMKILKAQLQAETAPQHLTSVEELIEACFHAVAGWWCWHATSKRYHPENYEYVP